MLKKNALFTIFCFLISIVGGPAFAVPGQIAYQGLLKDSGGSLLTGNYEMTFSIYSASTGGTPAWTETQTVTVESGLYNVQLGSGTAIAPSVFTGSTIYLGIKVGSDSEMTPRVALITVPYAFQAATVADDIVINTSGSITAASFSGDGSSLTNVSATTGDAYTLDGLNASDFVLKAGDTMTGTLTIGAVSGMYGLSSTTSHASGRAVYGNASYSGSGMNYGGYFEAGGSGGRAVCGDASGIYGYGVYGNSSGNSGCGVYGNASTTGGVTNYGGGFYAAGNTGYAIYCSATATTDATNYGGYFEAAGHTGRAVYGNASYSGSATNYGGYFQAAGGGGHAVYGNATATGDNQNYGGSFTAAGSTGRGVYGLASASAGTNYGIYGQTNSSSGYAGYFEGGRGVKVDGDLIVTGTIEGASPVDVTGGLNVTSGQFNLAPFISFGNLLGPDQEPSVSIGNLFEANSSAANTITGFSDGTEGQIITIIFNDTGNTTISSSSGKINLSTPNFNPADAGSTMQLVYDGSVWHEISRSENDDD